MIAVQAQSCDAVAYSLHHASDVDILLQELEPKVQPMVKPACCRHIDGLVISRQSWNALRGGPQAAPQRPSA